MLVGVEVQLVFVIHNPFVQIQVDTLTEFETIYIGGWFGYLSLE